MNEPARVCRDTSSRINYDRFEASEHVHHARNPGCDCVCVDLCRKWSKSVNFGWSRPPSPGNSFAPFSNRAISILYRFLADRFSVRALIEAQMRSIRIIRYRIAQISEPDISRGTQSARTRWLVTRSFLSHRAQNLRKKHHRQRDRLFPRETANTTRR